jgi:hypothetical protein
MLKIIEIDPKVYSINGEHGKRDPKYKTTKIKPKCFVSNTRPCSWHTRQGKFFDKKNQTPEDIYRARVAQNGNPDEIKELYRVKRSGLSSMTRDDPVATANLTSEPQSPLVRQNSIGD